MAVIGQAPSVTNDPNYINQSRGVASKTADTSLGTLFAGLGDVVDKTATLLDNNNRENIKTDLQNKIDAERDQFGVAAATDQASKDSTLFPNTPGKPQVPATVASATNEVNRLQSAYASGKLSDSYYWARINAITKQVRAANPGYRDYVDEQVAKITGGNPANRLRDSIQSELAAQQAQAQSAGNRWETFVNQNLEYIGQFAPDYFRNPGKYSQEAIREGVTRLQAQKAIVSQDIQMMERELKSGTLTAERAVSVATTHAQQVVGNTVNSVATQLSETLTNLTKGGKVPTTDEVAAFMAQANSLKQMTDLQVRQLLTKPFEEGGTQSFATAIKDPKKQQEIIDNALAPLNMIIDAASKGDYALVNLATSVAKNMGDSDKLTVLRSSNTMRSIAAVRQIAGDTAIAQIMTNPEQLGIQRRDLGVVFGQNFWERSAGDTSRPLTQKLKDLGSANGGRPRASDVKQEFNNIITGLTKGGPVVAANTAKEVFSKDGIDVLNKFPVAERNTVLTMMTSPEVIKSMAALKETSPEVWQNYRNWTRDGVVSVVKGAADNLQDSALNDQLLNIRYDKASNQFEVVPSDAYVRAQMTPTRNIQFSPEAYQARSTLLKASVDQMNKAITTMKPLIEADGGKVDQETIKTLMGVDVNTPKQAGFMNMIIDSLDGIYGNEPEENIKKAPEGAKKQSSIPGMLSFVSTAQAATDPAEGRALRPGRLADGKTNLQFGSADVENLSAPAKDMLQKIADSGTLPYIKLASGYRDPFRNSRAGGARNSQHMHGNAVDIDVSGYTDEQKSQLLEQAIAAGAKGIGIYPSGRSIHIDTRSTPALWGANGYRGNSVDQAPAWAQPHLRKLFGE